MHKANVEDREKKREKPDEAEKREARDEKPGHLADGNGATNKPADFPPHN